MSSIPALALLLRSPFTPSPPCAHPLQRRQAFVHLVRLRPVQVARQPTPARRHHHGPLPVRRCRVARTAQRARRRRGECGAPWWCRRCALLLLALFAARGDATRLVRPPALACEHSCSGNSSHVCSAGGGVGRNSVACRVVHALLPRHVAHGEEQPRGEQKTVFRIGRTARPALFYLSRPLRRRRVPPAQRPLSCPLRWSSSPLPFPRLPPCH